MPFHIPSNLLDRLRNRRAEQRESRGGRSAAPPLGQHQVGCFIDWFRPLFSATAPVELAAHDYVSAANEWQDEIEDKYDAFLLDPGMGPMVYLTSDGRILHDMRGWDGSETVEVTGLDARLALIVGARKTGIVELLDLIPPPPQGSSTCPKCHGKRMAKLVDGFDHEFACDECDARGWV